MKNILSCMITLFFLIKINSQIIDNFPSLCDFEDNSSCYWFNIEDDDDSDWLISPDLNSHVFVTSLSDTEEKQAWLEATLDLRDVEKADITFIYKIQTLVATTTNSNLKTIEPGTLQLDVNYKGKWIYDLWHSHSSDLKWKKQKIDLSEFCGELIILSFTGYIEVPWSEVCLDNILVTGK